MTPFKRLADSDGRDDWLESAARQVREGDPFALITEQQAQRLGAAALAHVRERPSRKGSRTLAIAFAVVASSAALAAAGRAVFARPEAQPPAPAPKTATVRGEAPAVAPPAPQPVPAPPAAPRGLERKAKAPVAKPAPRPAIAPAGESALDAEAKLLLEALHQLRVESDPDAALATLDAHDARFPEGALNAEAAAARAEARALKAGRSP